MTSGTVVAIMQPYFLPYLGYWQLMDTTDVFVVYDDVEFTKAGPRFPGRDGLEPVNAFRAMWFAWAAFYPGTEVIDG